jgi:hypothetical protein
MSVSDHRLPKRGGRSTLNRDNLGFRRRDVKVNRSVTGHREAQVGPIAHHRQQICPHRQTGDVSHIVLRDAEVDDKRTTILGQEDLVRVIGVPVRNVLIYLGERHLADVRGRGVGRYYRGDGVAAGCE